MKKLLLLIAIAFMFSCSEDEEKELKYKEEYFDFRKNFRFEIGDNPNEMLGFLRLDDFVIPKNIEDIKTEFRYYDIYKIYENTESSYSIIYDDNKITDIKVFTTTNYKPYISDGNKYIVYIYTFKEDYFKQYGASYIFDDLYYTHDFISVKLTFSYY